MTEPLRLPVNIEALVSAFLREQSEMVELVADRVYTAIPKPQPGRDLYPCVRVVQIIDDPTAGPLWGIAFDVQVEAFGGSKADAWRIAATARALISQRLAGTHPEGIVNGVTNREGFDQPDESFSPAKPRWLFTSTIHARPAATVAAS